MQRPKNMIVEVYSKSKDKRSLLARTMEEVESFLKTILKEENIQPIIDSLTKQRENPDVFPNIVLFLDENNEQMSIDQYMLKKVRKIDKAAIVGTASFCETGGRYAIAAMLWRRIGESSRAEYCEDMLQKIVEKGNYDHTTS
jgi:hypothetical protein